MIGAPSEVDRNASPMGRSEAPVDLAERTESVLRARIAALEAALSEALDGWESECAYATRIAKLRELFDDKPAGPVGGG